VSLFHIAWTSVSTSYLTDLSIMHCGSYGQIS